jgi:RNA polymerase sigma factor for flagellar operon FliA
VCEHPPGDDRDLPAGPAGPHEAALWAAWRQQQDAAARAALIGHHRDFARIMAGRQYARRVTDEVGFDDYLQLASVALIECVDRYDPAVGASFRTYASPRIAGAISNGLESMSERSRQLAHQRKLERERLASLGEEAAGAPADTPAEDRYERLAAVAAGLAMGFLLDGAAGGESGEGAYADNAYDRVLVRQVRQRLQARLAELPEREALVIRRHYLQGQAFDEIGEVLGLTRGRVSQLHRQALALLRQGLGEGDGLDLSM